jgi:membrane peptidoglycan carboxypeptidase
MKSLDNKENKIILTILLAVLIIFSVITSLDNKTSLISVNYNGVNPTESINSSPPSASTVIYAKDGEVIGNIYNSQETAYQYLQNPYEYQGKSILYHLINIPPYSSNPDVLLLATETKKDFLDVLKNNHVISTSDYNQAIANFDSPYFQVLHTPYFTEYVIRKLYQKYQKYLLTGGLKVYTTVSPYWNTIAQNIVTQDVAKYTLPYGASDAALVADNPSNGQIIAMVGGPNYSVNQINMADVPRHQGSSMKPLIYIKAFEMGYSPQTMIDDAPICYGSYCPTDYGGQTKGWMSITKAINQSINIPAIKMFARIGYQNGIKTLEAEGIKLNTNRYYGLPLILGDTGVSVVRMVGAYNALNNGGYYAQSTPFLKIIYNGKTLYNANNFKKKRILNANATAEMDTLLGDTAEKEPMYGPETYYYSIQGRPYGSKDGTTNGPKGITVYEFIPQLTVGVWAGNANDSLISPYAVGAFETGPFAHSFIMDYIKEKNLPVVNYPTPVYPKLTSETATIP